MMVCFIHCNAKEAKNDKMKEIKRKFSLLNKIKREMHWKDKTAFYETVHWFSRINCLWHIFKNGCSFLSLFFFFCFSLCFSNTRQMDLVLLINISYAQFFKIKTEIFYRFHRITLKWFSASIIFNVHYRWMTNTKQKVTTKSDFATFMSIYQIIKWNWNLCPQLLNKT